MGFLDKAKQMAEQAQQKLEETQKQFNEGQANKAAAGDPAHDPATAQGVAQPQPPAAAEPIEDQPAAEQPAQPPPVKDGVNASPDPFKPIQ